MSGWKTQKGDEWRYEDGVLVANGDLNSADGLFVVRDISSMKGEVSEKPVFRFLRETKESFPDADIYIKQSRLSAEINEMLTSLRNKGLISAQLSASSKTLIQVVAVHGKKGLLSW